MEAYVEGEETNKSLCYITCQMNQVSAGITVPFHNSRWFCSAEEQDGRQALEKRAYFAKVQDIQHSGAVSCDAAACQYWYLQPQEDCAV